MKFLAIDFGTSNCVAAFGMGQNIKLVPLEGNNHLLPSLLYVQRRVQRIKEATGVEFQREMARAKASENQRIREEEKEIKNALIEFDIRAPSRPKRPVKPKNDDFDNDTAFHLALERHEKDIADYSRELELFSEEISKHERKRNEFEQSLRAAMRPKMTVEELEKTVKEKLRREKVREQYKNYKTQTFFDALVGASECLTGMSALNAYTEDPDGGFFFRSPKTFLGSDIGSLYSEDFVKVIETLLQQIKSASERFSGYVFDGVVLGRPVKYHGVLGERGNRQAMRLMNQAAVNVGFKEIRFFLEPVAAAMMLSLRETIDKRNILIVDVGGGTTDCAFLENCGSLEPRYGVLAVSGDRLGGNDVDQAIAWMRFMPLLGKGSLLISGLPLPHSLLYDAISTRDLPAQQRFQESREELTNFLRNSRSPERIKRLIRLRAQKLQHRLILCAEELKILLSNSESETTNLGFLEKYLCIPTTADQLSESSERQIDGFRTLIMEAIEAGRRTPDVIYLTGGMMESKKTVDGLMKNLPSHIETKKMESFASVGIGLGRVANEFQSTNGEEIFRRYQDEGYAFRV